MLGLSVVSLSFCNRLNVHLSFLVSSDSLTSNFLNLEVMAYHNFTLLTTQTPEMQLSLNTVDRQVQANQIQQTNVFILSYTTKP